MAGITPQGFVTKTQEDIRSELVAKLQSQWGLSLDYSNEAAIGQLLSILAEREAVHWEILQTAYNANNPDNATGDLLASLAKLTGTLKKSPTVSTANVVAIGTNSTLIPALTEFEVEDTQARFASTADRTISTVMSWAPVNFPLGYLVTNDGNIYYCIATDGTNSSTPPTGTDLAIDGGDGYIWAYCGPGTAAVVVPCEALNTGATIAKAGSLNTIVTPVSGLDSVSNPVDATLGQSIESDEDLRARRVVELAGSGSGTVASYKAAVGAVSGVTNVTVLSNSTNVQKGVLNPHSVEVIVEGGSAVDIAKAIYSVKTAGIEVQGSTAQAILDSESNSQTIYFTRFAEVPIVISLEFTHDDTFPPNGVDLIKDAIVADGNEYPPGKSVYKNAIIASVFKVPGVIDVTTVTFGLGVPDPVPITQREKAVFSTGSFLAIEGTLI